MMFARQDVTMSMTFVKLFSSITESTVWCESSDIRVVWITMLAMSDRNGRVWGSIPGLANRSQVSVESTKKALDKFLSPDEYSRTKDFEGRRIENIEGGWRLLNHSKFRELQDEEERRIYKADWIKRKRNNVDNVDKSRHQSTHTDTDAYTDKDKKNKHIVDFEGLWKDYPNKDGKKQALKHFLSTVKSSQDLNDIKKALKNYKAHLERETWKRPKNGSTWFNNWHDWTTKVEVAQARQEKDF